MEIHKGCNDSEVLASLASYIDAAVHNAHIKKNGRSAFCVDGFIIEAVKLRRGKPVVFVTPDDGGAS